MKQKLFTSVMLLAAVLQVACGGKKDKTAAIQALMQQRCQASTDPAACMGMYTQAAQGVSTQIIGTAAASGQPQVAAAGTTPTAGQVTATSILPASISDSTIQKQAAAVNSALQTMNTASASSSGGTVNNGLAGASGASQVAVGVTRLPASDVLQTASAGPLVAAPAADVQPSVDNGAAVASEAASNTVSAGR